MSDDLKTIRKEIIERLEKLGVLPTKETVHRFIHVGASNYSHKVIQPWTVWLEYQLNPWDADIVKRVLRTKNIGNSPEETRIEDYQKIKHICDERIAQIKTGDVWND